MSEQNIIQVQANKDETILEALERMGIQHEYQCRSGYCGSCKCQIIKGRTTTKVDSMVLLNESEILPCISFCEDEPVHLMLRPYLFQ